MLFIETRDCAAPATITLLHLLSLTSCKQVALCHYQLLFWQLENGNLEQVLVGFFAITKLSLTKISTFTMGLMALNRYYKIVKPTKYLTIFKPKCIVITALLAWAIPFTLAFLLVFVLDQETKPNTCFAMCIISLPYLYFSRS